MPLPIPDALRAPPAELAAAWDKFIHNSNNHGHAARGLTGGNLASHLADVWQDATASAARIQAQTAPLAPQTILDLGASAGGLSLALCAAYPATKIYALEPEQEAFDVLCAMKSATQQVCLFPLLGGGEVLPLPDNSVDLIVCHQVLEHVRDPARVLAEVYRVLRPGGMVHLEMPNYLWPIEPHVRSFFIPGAGKGTMKFLAKLQGLPARKIDFLGHLQLVTKPMLENWMKAQGFSYYNLMTDKIFSNGTGVHHIHSGWKRRALVAFQSNPIGKIILRMILALGFHPSLLYRLQKPA